MRKLLILIIAVAAALTISALIIGAVSLKKSDEVLERADRFIERMEESR